LLQNTNQESRYRAKGESYFKHRIGQNIAEIGYLKASNSSAVGMSGLGTHLRLTLRSAIMQILARCLAIVRARQVIYLACGNILAKSIC